jgi:catechol 2,3-dioxygenase-like lactoylglutathione lyase family enzyme
MKRLFSLTTVLLLAGGSAFAAQPARPPIDAVSHISVYASDPAKAEAFYVHDLGAVKRDDPENPKGTRYYFSPVQFVEVLPLPGGPPTLNRLDHVAFATADAEALRKYLASRGSAVPAQLSKGADGSLWFEVKDPEGRRVEFVQAPAHPPAVPVNPLSSHIIHVGFIVHDRAKEDVFWQGVLGFRPYWAGGMSDDKPAWISLQTPDGTDWLEYMMQSAPDAGGLPAGMSQATGGVLNHFALGIVNAEAAYTMLWNGDRLRGQDNLPKIGRDAKWQLNLIDPDGTRAELMELHAIGKPCCSPFMGEDPKN